MWSYLLVAKNAAIVKLAGVEPTFFFSFVKMDVKVSRIEEEEEEEEVLIQV